MKASVRLALAAALFAAWISWLAYLAATTTRPFVLSRPQFLASTLDVIARVESDQNRPVAAVKIVDVHWPSGRESLKDQVLTINNIGYCAGWQGPGEYILPLVSTGDAYEVASIPPSPGYYPSQESPPLRIYVRTPETMRQLSSIPK